MPRCNLLAVGVVVALWLAILPTTSDASDCGLPVADWPCPSVPAPPWFDLQYWDELVFGCAEESERCRFVPPGRFERGHTRIPSAEAIQQMNIRIATNTGVNPPVDDAWIDTYRQVIPGIMTDLAGAPWLGSISVGSEPMESRGWIDIIFSDSRYCVSGGYWGNGRVAPPFLKPFGTWERGIVRLRPGEQDNKPDGCLHTVLLAQWLGRATSLSFTSDPNDVMCRTGFGLCTGLAWTQPARSQPVFIARSLRHIELAREVSSTNNYGGYIFYPGVLLPVAAFPLIALIILAALLIKKRLTCRV